MRIMGWSIYGDFGASFAGEMDPIHPQEMACQVIWPYLDLAAVPE